MFYFNVTQPISLANNPVTYFPSTWAASIPQNFVSEVLIHNDDPTGCNPYPATDKYGRSFSGKTILVYTGGNCQDSDKYTNIQQAGGVMYIGYACPFSQGCDLLISASFVPFDGADVPYLTIGNEDGVNMAEQILNNITVIITSEGTGPILPSQLNALVSFAQALEQSPDGPISPYTMSGSLRAWTDLLDSSLRGDPCLDRVMGIWCLSGEVVGLDLADWNIVNIPPEIGGLVSLRSFSAPYKGAPDLPCEFGQLTKLRQAILLANAFDINTADECWEQLTSLYWIDLSGNPLTALPSKMETLPLELFFAVYTGTLATVIDFRKIPTLIKIAVYNGALTTLPNLSGLPNLVEASFQYNQIQDTDVRNHFNNLPKLIYLDISYNSIQGPVPLFTNTPNLQYVTFAANSFSGTIPTWNLLSLTSLYANNNQLTGGVSGLSGVVNLAYYDLSSNMLDANADGLTSFIANLPKYSVEVNLNYNQIGGTIEDLIFRRFPVLTRFTIAHNLISTLPSDLLGDFILVEYLDFSYNAIEGDLPPAGPIPSTYFVNLLGNPNMISASTDPTMIIPDYLLQSDTFQKTSRLDRYLCPVLVSSSPTQEFTFLLDPVSYRYFGCICDQGYYGDAPLCDLIPVQTALTNHINDTFINFTDASYGNNRFQQGIDTIWQVSRSVDPQQVQVVYFSIEVDNLFFDNYTDIISIYEGGSDLRGDRIFLLRGSDNANPESLKFRPSDSYEKRENTTTYKIAVFASLGTLNFQSRQVGQQHFTAQITFSDQCPEGFTNTLSTQCRFLKVYKIDNGLVTAVAVLTAIALAFILFIVCYIFKYRGYIIIKSASPLFCLLTLFGLMVMALASLTYVADPADGQWVCDIRVWGTATSIILILGNLIVKANRINNIFNDMTFQVRAYSDGNLLKTVGFMLLVEFVVLAFFTGFALSAREIATGEGSDPFTLVLVHRCSTSTVGYWVWFGIQFAYLGVFIVGSAYVAFMTKDTPTAFNESNHILGALLEFLFLPLIFVPLNFFLENSPASLVVLRGFGQNFIVMTLTFILFGPKLYYIGAGRGNDDNLSDLSRASQTNKLDVEMIPASSTSEISPTNSPMRESQKFSPREQSRNSFHLTATGSHASHVSHPDETGSVAEQQETQA